MQEQTQIAIIGLGPVGLTLAIALAKHVSTMGYDTSVERCTELENGIDNYNLHTKDNILSSKITFTHDKEKLKSANTYIISVPTLIDKAHVPLLAPLEAASKTISEFIEKGNLVVYESTVYPGATEEVCIPILEKHTELSSKTDFHVGYSPERINPGDNEHTLKSVKKIVSAQTEAGLTRVKEIYSLFMGDNIFPVSSIKVAEAAKAIENANRDVNISFTNEIAFIMDKMGISTKEVLDAAASKWNFIRYQPGLVGGNCISVDPYYLIYKAHELGYNPRIITASREINEKVKQFIVEKTILLLTSLKINPVGAKVAILGITFKENFADTRNAHAKSIITTLEKYGINTVINDPVADPKTSAETLDVTLTPWENIKDIDAMVILINHKYYHQLSIKEISSKFKGDKKLIIDVKSMLNNEDCKKENITLWQL